MLDLVNFNKVLLVGSGGGNDICSTALISAYLKKKGIHSDIAGMCSPAANHFYDLPEKPINRVTAKSRRIIPLHNGKDINFIDRLLPELFLAHGLSGNVFNLSLAFGTDALVEELNKFIKEQGYDAVIAVDVGGDILARGEEDPTILSPLMDFGCLYVLSQIDSPTLLLEFGLQTDGELRPQGCSEIFAELERNKMILATDHISIEDEEVKTFESIYEVVKKERAGNTARMTLETLRANEDIVSDYRQTYQVFDTKWELWHKITLEQKYFGKLFTIDLKALASSRILAFPFCSPLEQTLKTKMFVDTKTEMDLLYANVDDIKIWIGLPSPMFRSGDQISMVLEGMWILTTHADVAIIWGKHTWSVAADKEVYCNPIGEFMLFGERADVMEKVSQKVEEILA